MLPGHIWTYLNTEQAASGKLVFAPGEASKVFEVSIVNDDSWDATLEFKLHLDTPEGCSLGRYQGIYVRPKGFLVSGTHGRRCWRALDGPPVMFLQEALKNLNLLGHPGGVDGEH